MLPFLRLLVLLADIFGLASELGEQVVELLPVFVVLGELAVFLGENVLLNHVSDVL